MAYDPRVIRRLINIGRRRNVGREAILGALATGIVESGLTNIRGGDADSSGWRQERASLYPNPNNLRASINRFYDEWAQHDTAGFNPGQTAANVQRPAAQYRGRYAEQMEEARRLLARYSGGNLGGDVGAPGSGIPILGQAVQNPIEQIASLYQGDPNSPYTGLMQRGWELLSQAWEQQNPQRVELGSDSFLANLGGTPSPEAGDGKITISPNADRPGVSTNKAVVNFVRGIAGATGNPLTIGTGTNHSQYTVNGNVSDHWDGNAADVPLTGRALVQAGRAALIQAGMSPAEARKINGGLFNVGGWQIIFNTMEGGNHRDHLHVGRRH